jgi:acyl carrier protein
VVQLLQHLEPIRGLRRASTETQKVLDELKVILAERLRFDTARVAILTAETSLPKGIDGSLGLDSLDFIEISLGIEDRFGLVMDEREDLAPHFQSLGTLAGYIKARLNDG